MAADTLPVLGTLTYGDFEFNATTETLGYQITPVYDAAKRTVVVSRWSITLRTLLEGDPADNAVRRAVAQLSRPADVLLSFDRGTPPLKVNLHDQRDAEYGPRPQVLQVKAHGDRTTEITWTVEFSLATCDDRVYGGLMEFNYRLKYDIDQDGLTVLTYSGHIKIAATRERVRARTLPDSADAYRERVVPPLRYKFRRVSQTWELDESKRGATFSVVDREWPKGAPPLGVLEWNGSHTCSTRAPGGLQWLWHLEAEYTLLSPGYPLAATSHFGALLQDRIAEAKKMAVVGADGRLTARKCWPVPWAFTASEPDLAGLTRARFSVSYTLAGTPLSEILRSSGMWKAVPAGRPGAGALTGNAHLNAYTEFQKEVAGPRGQFRLAFNLSDDRIVDLCERARTTAPTLAPPPLLTTDLIAPAPRPLAPGTNPLLAPGGANPFAPPPSAGSWLNFVVNTHVWVSTGAVPVKTLPTQPIRTGGHFRSPGSGWDLSAGGAPLSGNFDPSPYPPAAAALDASRGDLTVQQRTSATLFVAVTGFALRAGWTIPVPTLSRINGVRPALVEDPDGGPVGFEQGVVRDVGLGIPVYGARFRMVYACPEVPSRPIEPVLNANLA